MCQARRLDRRRSSGEGGGGEGRGGRGSSWRGEGAASGRKRTVFRDDAVSSTDFNFPRSKQRERERPVYIHQSRDSTSRDSIYPVPYRKRGGGKDCVNDDERKRESEREKKRDF